VPGVYLHPRPLFLAEMAALAHADWVLVPLTVAMGVWALRQFVRRRGEIAGRYAHATAVILLWLTYIGAVYYVSHHLRWSAGGIAAWALWGAAAPLVVGTAAGLTLRHTAPERRRTPRLLAVHMGMAVLTAGLVTWGLWPYH
jgi:uncharacterized membrane protein (GlpM family)